MTISRRGGGGFDGELAGTLVPGNYEREREYQTQWGKDTRKIKKMRKKDKHIGQLPLTNLDAALEEEILRTDRPNGMPPLSAIQTETRKLSLPDSDAEAIYDVWLSNGFKLGNGQKIKNFKATIRTWHRNEFFPSQRKAARGGPSVNKAEWTPPTLEELKAYASQKRWSAGFARHCYSTWVANNWRHYGQPISSDEQWKAIMDSMDYRP